ncbi:MAG: RnfABCDGE type electron transport complex subunit B [Clostridia bacterium]|nr:RnfABCDGE type electron transport complex subunit B [Clostridia bacterium]
MEAILIPVIIVAVIGLIAGLGLSLAGKYLSDPPDEKFEAIRESLPGANCGACGYNGCDDYANAVKNGIAKPDKCIPGGPTTAAALSVVLGVEIEAEQKVAFIACGGDCNKSKTKYNYSGIQSCSAAAALYGGPMECSFGCIGLGDCASVCEYGGITVTDNLAKIDPALCRACGKCISACPKKLISFVPASSKVKVLCHSNDKGAKVMKACEAGCIGCTKCVKVCEFDAIKVENFLAVIDPKKCTSCGKCKEVCPRGCIN